MARKTKSPKPEAQAVELSAGVADLEVSSATDSPANSIVTPSPSQDSSAEISGLKVDAAKSDAYVATDPSSETSVLTGSKSSSAAAQPQELEGTPAQETLPTYASLETPSRALESDPPADEEPAPAPPPPRLVDDEPDAAFDSLIQAIRAGKSVDINAPLSATTPLSPDSETVLHRAARRADADAVELILARNDVDPNRADSAGRTPLLRAVATGAESVVALFLVRRDVDCNKPAAVKDGEHPLHAAIRAGHEGVAGALLERDDLDTNRFEGVEGTPLHLSVAGKRYVVLKKLLARADLDSGKTDGKGRTALDLAQELGDKTSEQLLSGKA